MTCNQAEGNPGKLSSLSRQNTDKKLSTSHKMRLQVKNNNDKNVLRINDYQFLSAIAVK